MRDGFGALVAFAGDLVALAGDLVALAAEVFGVGFRFGAGRPFFRGLCNCLPAAAGGVRSTADLRDGDGVLTMRFLSDFEPTWREVFLLPGAAFFGRVSERRLTLGCFESGFVVARGILAR